MPKITVGEPGRPPVLIEELDRAILLQYVDGSGAASERKVTLHDISGWLNQDRSIAVESLKGFCHLRKSARTFQLQRIRALTDPETGEGIADLLTWLNISRHL